MKLSYIKSAKDALIESVLMEVHSTGNSRAIRMFLFASIVLAYANRILAKEATLVDNPITQLGKGAIGVIQLGLTILAIIMALFETGKAMLEGDPKRITSVAAKYGIGVILTYAIPWIYFEIKGAFDGWELN